MPINKFDGDYPWFDGSASDIPFHVFGERLRVVWLALDHFEGAVDRSIQADREEVKQFLAAVERDAPDYRWEARSEADAELGYANELLPRLAFGGLAASALTCLEHLIFEVCRWYENENSGSLKAYRLDRRLSKAEGMIKFLRDEVGVSVDLDEQLMTDWAALRRTRNSLMHTLGDDSEFNWWRKPDEAIVEVDPSNRTLVEDALSIATEIAYALEHACDAFEAENDKDTGGVNGQKPTSS